MNSNLQATKWQPAGWKNSCWTREAGPVVWVVSFDLFFSRHCILFGHSSRKLYWLICILWVRNLATNKLEGPIPRNISSCTALNHLYVIRVLFSMNSIFLLTIFKFIFIIINIILFHLRSNVHGNRLSGSIPQGFRNLGSLTYL